MKAEHTDGEKVGGRSNVTSRLYALALWALASLFTLRVLGQAIQRWWPQPYLPAFGAFQGSGLAYSVLLSAQIGILWLMIRASWRVGTGRQRSSARRLRILGWFGGAYMAGSILRIVIGLASPDAPPWFRTWIPALFHLVLAGFVVVLALHCRRQLAYPDRQQGVAV